MSVAKVTNAVLKFFETVLEKTGRVIEVKPSEDGWCVLVETIEEGEYMRKVALDEIIAVYEVTLNQNFDVTGYSRKSMRPRTEAA